MQAGSRRAVVTSTRNEVVQQLGEFGLSVEDRRRRKAKRGPQFKLTPSLGIRQLVLDSPPLALLSLLSLLCRGSASPRLFVLEIRANERFRLGRRDAVAAHSDLCLGAQPNGRHVARSPCCTPSLKSTAGSGIRSIT